MLKSVFIFFMMLFSCTTMAQSYRGIAPYNDTICWVSGSKGSIIKTEDGGNHWDTISPIGYSTKEFRDIHVYSPLHALVMSSGDSAVILRTRNGGINWQLVHSNQRAGVFYDAMDAFGPYICVIGDPYKDPNSGNYIFDMLLSCDSGETWDCNYVNTWKGFWQADSGEAFFAASGSNLILSYSGVYSPENFQVKNLHFSMISGGTNSRLYEQGIRQGLQFDRCSSCGPYSFAKASNKKMVIVGGNYLKPDYREKTCFYFDQTKRSITPSQIPPGGYRSCVAEYRNGQLWVCTGTNGSDISRDDGKTWTALSVPGFNACAFSNQFLWLCGDKGRVLRIPVTSL